MTRTLKDFAEWYIQDGTSLRIDVPKENALRVGPNSTEMILYREPPFQVAIVTFFPGYIIPPHSHKHVSAYALSLAGDGHAFVGGNYWTKKVHDKPRLDLRIPVLAGVNHYGYTDKGAIFLSIQKWKGCEPKFIVEDWVCDVPFGEFYVAA